MSHHQQLYQWNQTIARHLPLLSKSQAHCLALWTLGMVLAPAKKRAWRKEWLRLLRLLGPALPNRMCVLVLADRGLYARWLFRRIVRLGWHPLLRVNSNCTFRPAGSKGFRPMWSFAASP